MQLAELHILINPGKSCPLAVFFVLINFTENRENEIDKDNKGAHQAAHPPKPR